VSLRAKILRLCLRWCMKRNASPDETIEEIRLKLEAAKRWVPDPPTGTTATKLDVAGTRAIRVATPRSRDDRHILYLHGGAYVYGSPSHYRDFIWRIAEATSSRVLVLDYRLAPEHPFPAAVEDAAKAYRWMLAEGCDPRRIAFMGDSAGGGLVFAALLMLRDQGVALPAAAVAMSPWTDLTLTSMTIRRNVDIESMLSAEQSKNFAAWYLAGADPRNAYASPLYSDPAGLPPSLILVGDEEILLDDARGMAERLRNAGCHIELDVWPGMPHVWPLFARLVPESRAAVERMGDFVQRTAGTA
jgi:acetyl esterase/lipase